MSRDKVAISSNGPILPGSLMVFTATCGKKNCACYTDPDKSHGPYYRWTGLINKKRAAFTLTAAQYNECLARNNNYKRLLKQLDQAVGYALKNAPWNDKAPP